MSENVKFSFNIFWSTIEIHRNNKQHTVTAMEDPATSDFFVVAADAFAKRKTIGFDFRLTYVKNGVKKCEKFKWTRLENRLFIVAGHFEVCFMWPTSHVRRCRRRKTKEKLHLLFGIAQISISWIHGHALWQKGPSIPSIPNKSSTANWFL